MCIHIAINKMYLCSLSITHPKTLQHHLIHNVGISKLLTHMTAQTLYAVFLEHYKLGFTHEENKSPTCQIPPNVGLCLLSLVMARNYNQVKKPMRTTGMQMSIREMVSLCAESLLPYKPTVLAAGYRQS